MSTTEVLSVDFPESVYSERIIWLAYYEAATRCDDPAGAVRAKQELKKLGIEIRSANAVRRYRTSV